MNDTKFYGQRDIEYSQYLKSLYGRDNSIGRRILIQKLRNALKEELTPRQLYIMKLYFVDELKMPYIADILGVNKSTVSRTLKRGKNRLRKCLQYGASELLIGKDKEY